MAKKIINTGNESVIQLMIKGFNIIDVFSINTKSEKLNCIFKKLISNEFLNGNSLCWNIIPRRKSPEELRLKEVQFPEGQPLSEIGVVTCQPAEKSFLGIYQYLKTDSMVYWTIYQKLIDNELENIAREWLTLGGWESVNVRSIHYNAYLAIP